MFRTVAILLISFTSALADLYNSSDPVVILDNKNFYENILSSKTGWIVEFYNSWCGHCIHFVPVWREFAREVKDWSHTFSVGVIDCSDEENVSICRDYEVMGYPSVRLFGAFTKKGDFGVNVNNRGVKEMETAIIDFIIEKQTSNNISASSTWVDLLPYNGLVKDVLDNAPLQVKVAVLIFENEVTKLGDHSILDLGKYPMIYARKVKSDSKAATDLNLQKFPSILIVSRDGKTDLLKESPSTSEELTALIINHLGLLKQLAKANTQKSVGLEAVKMELEKSDREEAAGDGKPEEINSERLNYDDELPDAAYNSHIHQVYMVEIENAISYSLRSEVTLHKTISSESYIALKNFIKTMVKYLPLRSHVKEFLTKLHEFLVNRGDTLLGTDFEKGLRFLDSSSAKLPDKQPWRECQGSQPNYRGYPCGLWILFHTLTVGALVSQEENSLYDPQEPLKAIHGYVKNFFSCSHCSKHFQEMYSLDAETSVRAPGDEVLWLWKGHNKVNKRLKGDLSEDPKHPKETFPSREMCPKCWTEQGEHFNPDEIIHYLKKIYGKDAISLEGTQNISEDELHKENKQSIVFNSRRKGFLEKKLPDPVEAVAHKSPEDEQVSRNMEKVSVKLENDSWGQERVTMKKINTNSWGFSSTDVNLCILLYLCSTLIIAAGYFMFILKRKLRRRKYFELYKLP